MEDFANIRARVPQKVKTAFDRMLVDRKISMQDAIAAMMVWIAHEEPLVQVQVLGQVPSSDRADLTRIVLKRLAAQRD